MNSNKYTRYQAIPSLTKTNATTWQYILIFLNMIEDSTVNRNQSSVYSIYVQHNSVMKSATYLYFTT